MVSFSCDLEMFGANFFCSLATLSQIGTLVEETLGGIDRDLTSELSKKQAEFDHWHAKIRESARARQMDQNELDSLKRKASDRSNVGRRIKNLERDSEDLIASLEKYYGNDFDISKILPVGYGDRSSGIDVAEFSRVFSEYSTNMELSSDQRNFLASLPSAATLEARLEAYQSLNKDIYDEIKLLKSRNVVLGENYRRVVMACTGFSAEQVDEAAEGLTKHIKELNDNPVSEEEAIEILMRDRGQDW